MKEENVGSIIIEDDRRPVGIVTDRDLVLEVLEPRADPKTLTASDIMTETPVTIDTDAGVFDVSHFDSSARTRPTFEYALDDNRLIVDDHSRRVLSISPRRPLDPSDIPLGLRPDSDTGQSTETAANRCCECSSSGS